MLTTSPSYSESISFINFMASMMHSTWPLRTASPTDTNALASGAAARYNGPTIGYFTMASSLPSGAAGAAAATAGATGAASTAGACGIATT